MLFKGLSVREPAPLAPGRVGGVAAALTVVVTGGARCAVFPAWGRPGASERASRPPSLRLGRQGCKSAQSERRRQNVTLLPESRNPPPGKP